ncbi:cysteine desulfurase [Geovibrio thiophilus]|uniref:Cysteine desulfurase n=1 Tax=Geovibrio thiophilus TaxID=139438 RepID=A0A3R5Y6V4_9BACT|nr:cysteine desulfurase family protein [Geovibrio thiophilus]QAR33138.1 cysteine desulfurase [Geovibrio thiophilus]
MAFLDNVAGTRPDSRVVDKMLPFLTEYYGNPSAHFYPLGRESFEAVQEARRHVAELIGAEEEEVIFTSCGTESNNLAVKGVLKRQDSKKHVIISEIEHFSVQNPLISFMNDGYEITKLRVAENGLINLEDLKKAIRSDTALVSVMLGNPEIGTVQHNEEIGRICKEKGVLYHIDAIAGAGHIEVDVNKLNCDLLSLSAQNFYGPRGAAALYIRQGTKVASLMQGGHQEFGYRSGSENVAAIVGMGEAARIAKAEMHLYSAEMKRLSKRLWEGLANMFDFLHFTGHPERRLPGHVSFWIEFIEGESLLMWLALKGIYAASGSACSSNILAEDEEDLQASPVLTAVGVPSDICAGSITFSLSRYTTDAEVDKVLEELPGIVTRLCEMSPAYNKGN